jgi:hypothetical protein
MKKTIFILSLFISSLSYAQWNSSSNTTFYSLTNHANRPSDFGLNLQPSGGNPSYLIENNNSGVNRQLFFFGHGNSAKNIFGISSSTDNGVNWLARFSINQNGNVGIGTANPSSHLTVNGKILCEEVEVIQDVTPDYVFQKYYTGNSILKDDYKMLSLEEIEAFTKANHHLPNVPSSEDIKENGLQLKEMTNILLEKIEELTLYTIEQEKRIKALEAKLENKQ